MNYVGKFNGELQISRCINQEEQTTNNDVNRAETGHEQEIGKVNSRILGIPDANSDLNNESTELNKDETIVFEYRARAKDLVDRLTILGFTLTRAQEDFETGVDKDLAVIASLAQETQDLPNSSYQFQRDLELEERCLKHFKFDNWVSCMKKIIDNHITPWPLQTIDERIV